MINFFVELDSFKLKEIRKKKQLIKKIIEVHNKKAGDLTYIFMSDEDLLKINLEYLKHNTYTDIITFDNSEKVNLIEGDIFISIDRVKENAQKFNVAFEIELVRVISHGVLHLIGYKDKKEDEVKQMRKAEESAINIYSAL